MSTYMIDNLKAYFPYIARDMEEWCETDRGELIIRMQNGDTFLYDDDNQTLRLLPKDCNSMTEDECLFEFGKRLRKIMFYKGFNQAKLSSATGIPQGVISGYVTGRINPGFYNVDRIAKALGCSIEDFRYTDIFNEGE